MKPIAFTKMTAAGNDFVVIDNRRALVALRRPAFVKKLCDRRYGAGADGLLLLEPSRKADVRMRIFNADGSEAQMCGNGARCAALYFCWRGALGREKKITLETLAGIIDAAVAGDEVTIKLTDPEGIRLDVDIAVNGRRMKVNYINTGVPHTVIFTQGINEIDVSSIGRIIRFHDEFTPAGTNVDFIEVIDQNAIRVRTYERGVEDETLACGTGSVAAALVFAVKSGIDKPIKVHTKSGEILTVYYTRNGDGFSDVRLKGNAKIVYTGEYHV